MNKAADILLRYSKSKRIYLDKISKHMLRETLQRSIDYVFQNDENDKFLKKALSIAKNMAREEAKMWEAIGNETFMAAVYLPC